MLSSLQAREADVLLACPICRGPLAPTVDGPRCQGCAVAYPFAEGVLLLGSPLAAGERTEWTSDGPCAERMRRLAADAASHGWEEARARFADDVLTGRLPAPAHSRLARLRAKITGATWEDALQDLVDPTCAAWKFLLDLRQDARVCFLGPSWGAAPLSFARSCNAVVVLDGAIERLELTRLQALGRGLDNLRFARVSDPLALPLPDGSADLVVVPGLDGWLTAVHGSRAVPADAGRALLREIRRVLTPAGQVYVGADNRYGVSSLLGARRTAATGYSRATLRRAADEAGFGAVALFAPLPFRHKFHQILDVTGTERMNFCMDPYRTRGRILRPLVKLWDRLNRGGALERPLYSCVPGLGAVLSNNSAPRSFAERLLGQVADVSDVPPSARRLSRYYVRAKGAVVLAGGNPANDGIFIRLPLSESAKESCQRQHAAAESLVCDERIPLELRRLFPTPLAQGQFEGQVFFAEKGLPGESGRLYYSRTERRFDSAIINAAEVLRRLRRATEVPTRIGETAFERICGGFLRELRGVLEDGHRHALDVVEARLRSTLVGSTLPLGWHHGDYDFANLLYGPDDSVTGILDFEVFEPLGLPLIDFLVLLARRPIRRQGFAFGTLFARVILERNLPPLESELLEREMRTLGIDEPLYRSLALCCWLNHLRLRRDSWLVRSSSWLDENLFSVIERVRRVL